MRVRDASTLFSGLDFCKRATSYDTTTEADSITAFQPNPHPALRATPDQVRGRLFSRREKGKQESRRPNAADHRTIDASLSPETDHPP